MHCAEMQDALKERCAYLIFIALFFWLYQLVATIIRRQSRIHILKDIKREQVEIAKTGVHTNPIVNEAIDRIDVESRVSGSGVAPASTTVPKLLKKRRELERTGKR